VAVIALQAAPPLGEVVRNASREIGSAFSFGYTFDGTAASASAPQRVAFGCAADDLRVTSAGPFSAAAPSATPSAARPPAPAAARSASRSSAVLPTSTVLRFRNVSAQTCAIEGYPGVIASSATGISTPADEVLFGPNGGIRRSGEPLVILLKPGAVASAVVDSASETASGDLAQCKTISSLQVELPSGAPVPSVKEPLQVCRLEIHPLVLGQTGSDG
jgi:hypothetical protein